VSCGLGCGLQVVFPHLAGVVIEGAGVLPGLVCLRARVRGGRGRCPRCGVLSARVHSRYGRRLADAPIGGRRVVIQLVVRRFFCLSRVCPARTFAEQVEGLTVAYARRTPLAERMLEAVGLALAGRAGARLAAGFGLAGSRATVLRLAGGLPDPQRGGVAVLGVDDFALRRGRVYGTVLVNVETGKPVDLLPDREAGTFAVWLRAHPGTAVICRDRAGAYAEGARRGAPKAVQVADRWHLWHNLAGHAEKEVARHLSCLDGPEPDRPAAASGPAGDLAQAAVAAVAATAEASRLVTRTRQRYQDVAARRAEGKSIGAIARDLGLSKATVHRFYRASSPDELLAKARDRPSILDAYKPFLHQRWNEGATSARQLHAEITARGYRGSYCTVRDYLAPFRALGAAPPPRPAVPKARDITAWMLRHPDSLDAGEHDKLGQVRARCPHLDALAGHITEFAKILTGRHGDRLDAWIDAAGASDLPALRSFTTGLKADHAAVLAGLTLPYSSGTVEGNVNRIKMIKRQMYGRASFTLLRKRVLLAT
jgi:transposase